jgi:hypothetical protein
LNQDESINIPPGSEIMAVEVVVDTEGLPFGGYSYGLSITPAFASGISHVQSSLPPFISLGAGAINEATGTVSGIAQASFFGNLPAGVYVLDTIEFLATSVSGGTATISAGFESAGDAFIVDGQTCPGSQPNCSVTFHSLQVASPSDVPLLSPFATSLLIAFLGISSLWTLGSFRKLSEMGRTAKHLLLLLLLFSSLSVGVLGVPLSAQAANSEAEKTSKKVSVDAASPTLADDWGIEFVALRLSAQNRFLDFRYRVLNKEKAERLFGPKIKPVLLDSSTGHALKVPVPPKLGPMKATRGTPHEGRVYFVFFANPGGLVEPGHEVKVDFGELEISGLTVQ